MTKKTCLLFCRCGGWAHAPADSDEMAHIFHEIDTDVFELNDLCAFSLSDKSFFQSINNNYDFKIIVACYYRSIKNIFIQADIKFDNYEVLSFKELNKDQVFDQLRNKFRLQKGNAWYNVMKTSLNVPAWFPVIDKTRCTLCGQCAEFCMFGVYKFDNKKLVVSNPLSCKNKCPACGRNCPSSAIIFPRLAEKSSLAGADTEVKKDEIAGKTNSLFVQLNERNKAQKIIFANNAIQMAEEERKKALDEIRRSHLKKD